MELRVGVIVVLLNFPVSKEKANEKPQVKQNEKFTPWKFNEQSELKRVLMEEEKCEQWMELCCCWCALNKLIYGWYRENV